MAEDWPTARYRLKARAYMPRMPGFDHEMLEPGTEVFWNGKPGPHMDALDEAGAEALLRAGPQSLDPFGSVPLGAAVSDEDVLAERIGAALAKALPGVLAAMTAQQAPIVHAAPAPAPAPLAVQPPMQPPPPPAPPTPPTPPTPPPPPPPPDKGKGK